MINSEFSLMNTYVQVYTGEGKGKTTASLGLTIRHLGQGGGVLYTQFCKGDKDAFPSGEKIFCRVYSLFRGGKFTFKNFGSRYKWETPNNITFKDKIQAERDFFYVYENCRKYTLVVLDEIAHALKCDLVSVREVIELIAKCKGYTELVLTGRDLPESILEKANLITTMQPTEHYWNIGVTARKGIEY